MSGWTLLRRTTEPVAWKATQLRVIGATAISATRRAMRPQLEHTVPTIIELAGTSEAMRTVLLPDATNVAPERVGFDERPRGRETAWTTTLW